MPGHPTRVPVKQATPPRTSSVARNTSCEFGPAFGCSRMASAWHLLPRPAVGIVALFDGTEAPTILPSRIPGARHHCRPCRPRVKFPGALPVSAWGYRLAGARLPRPLASPFPSWEPYGIRQECSVDGLPGRMVEQSTQRSDLSFGCR